MRLLAVLSAAAVLAAAAGPGAAVAQATSPASCVWEKLPKQKRDELQVIYDRSLDEGLQAFLFTEVELNDAYKSCGVQGSDEIGKALGSYEIEVMMTDWLARNYGVTRAGLNAAWVAAAPTVRLAVPLPDGAERTRTVETVLGKAAEAAGIPEADRVPGPAMTRLALYLLNRGRREAIELAAHI